MTISPFYICVLLFFAFGLRIGWAGQIVVLLAASLIVSLSAIFFVHWSEARYFLHLLIVAASFDAAIQLGFIIGLFTATHPASIPLSRARMEVVKARKIAKLNAARKKVG